MKLFFEALNIFPYKVNFNYKKKLLFHTVSSQIFSILVYIIMIFCFYKFSEDFIKKKNPKLSIKEKLFQNYREFNFTEILNYINYTFDITLYTNNSNENLNEAIKSYFNINFEINDYGKDENIKFYFNDFENIQIVNLTDNIKINNNINKPNENISQTDSKNFRFMYNITFDATINRNTPLQFKSFSSDLFTTANISEYLIYKNNSNINIKYIDKLSTTFENALVRVNTDYYFYSTFNQNQSNGIKIELNDKIGFFCSYDSIIDPEIIDFAIKDLEKYRFAKEGYIYNYQLIELIEDTGLIFTDFQSKYIMQIDSWSSITLGETGNGRLDNFWFEMSKKVKSQTRIYKKVQNILAEIGGIFSIFIVIGNVVMEKFNQTTFEINIINTLFSNDNKKIIDSFKIDEKNLSDKNLKINSSFFAYNNVNKSSKESDSKAPINLLYQNKIINDDYPNEYRNPKENTFSFENNDTTNRKLFELNSLTQKQNLDAKVSPIINDMENINKDQSFIERISLTKHENNSNISKETIRKFLIEKNRRIKQNPLISFSELKILKFLFCCKRFKDDEFLKQEQFYSQAEKKINRYLDVQKLMKLFENFEKLKSLILNKHQINAFDYFKKRDLREIHKNKEETLLELYKYFKGKELVVGNHNIISDEKIILLLDQDITNLFNI